MKNMSLAKLLTLVFCCGLLFVQTSCSICRDGCLFRFGVPSCFCSCSSCQQVSVCENDCTLDYVPEGCSAEELMQVDLTDVPPNYLEPQVLDHDEYKIAVGDLLEVSLLTGDEDSVTNVLVAPDGMIYYLFLPPVRAENRTALEVAEDLRVLMRDMFTEPTVAVVPIEKIDLNYKILGQVTMPGVYPLVTAVNLREAIALAGGLNTGSYLGSTIALASLANSYLVRDGEKLNIDFKSLVFQGDDSQNIYLKKGDYIHIGSAVNDQVFVLGPRFGEAIPLKQNMTLVGALTPFYLQYQRDPYIAGKWTNVIIIRGKFECPCVIPVDFMKIITGEARDINLMAGDYIYVPDRDLPFGRQLVRIAIEAFVSGFSSAGAGYYITQYIGQ